MSQPKGTVQPATDAGSSRRSALRLRIGIILIVLFWLPAWLLGPAMAELFGMPVARATTAIMLVQGAVGILGVLIAGSEIKKLKGKVTYKKAPGVIWKILKTGKFDDTL